MKPTNKKDIIINALKKASDNKKAVKKFINGKISYEEIIAKGIKIATPI